MTNLSSTLDWIELRNKIQEALLDRKETIEVNTEELAKILGVKIGSLSKGF